MDNTLSMSTFISPHGWSMLAWLIVFNALLVILLALRWYSARLLQRSFRLDDGLIVGAYVRIFAEVVTYRRAHGSSGPDVPPSTAGYIGLG